MVIILYLYWVEEPYVKNSFMDRKGSRLLKSFDVFGLFKRSVFRFEF